MNLPGNGQRDIVAMGGSAGALDALKRVVRGLPADFPAAVFVTVHIPGDFPSILPHLLSSAGPLPALHPTEREPIRKGVIYVAPPDYHLLVEKNQVVTSRGPRENRHRPAIDPLFRSAARSFGARVIGVLLSGQLDDGSAGLSLIRMRGGLGVVQDPKDAESPEMPSHAIQYGAADHVLPAEQISQLLVREATNPAPDRKHQWQDIPTERGPWLPAESPKDVVRPTQGAPSPFSCPECGGVLWETDEGGVLTFRCRVGHAYSAESLRMAISDASESALWAAMRALEEKAALFRRLASRGGERMSARYQEDAEAFARHADTIRHILLDSETG